MSTQVKEICAVCNQEDDNLVKPCKTLGCDAKIHYECLEDRFALSKKSCTKCEFPIAVEQLTTFNWIKCGKTYFGVIYTFLMVFFGTYINIKSAMGDSPLNPNQWDTRGCYKWKEDTNPHTICDSHSILVIVLSFALSLMFWQFPIFSCRNPTTKAKEKCRCNIFSCGKNFKNDKNRAYVTMLIMFLISNFIIFVTHKVGQYSLNDYSSHTWQTFANGLITYLWILFYIVIVILCVGIPYLIFYYTIEGFTTKKIILGESQLKLLSDNSKTKIL